jgi:ubiquinone/menaquinone biosynthesis C-methylase UbiE
MAHLPSSPADVIDLGCGTGTLSVLLASDGYRVRGLDQSQNMVNAACRKTEGTGLEATFQCGDAADPPYEDASCDVVLSRHVLWAMPDPSAALARWAVLLRPGGRLLLIEGYWFTDAGIRAAECERLLAEHGLEGTVHILDDPTYWGKKIEDERYLIVSTVRGAEKS